MDKKSVREAKAHKRDRNKLKKRKVDDNGNLAVSSAHVQIQCEDAPEEKFMKNKKSVREAKAHKRDRNILKKRKVDDNGNLVVSSAHVQIQCEDAPEEKFMKNKKSDREAKAHKSERIKSKNRKVDGNENLVTSPSHDQTLYEDEPGVMFMKPGEANKVEREKRKDVMTKKRKKEMGSKANAVKSCEDENDPANPKCSGEVDASCTTGSCQTETQNEIANTAKAPEEVAIANRSKKASKVRKKDRLSSKMTNKLKGKKDTVHQDEVYYISSEDEDCSRGMKKWIMEYHQSRPGLKILQERIDEFITAHESQEEQARKEREIQAAEGGWTVVVHHKGRKKTTDSESGVTVGSVAQAAVVDKMSKKKSKEVGLDFYRFQRREAQRNEIMMLQSKFEQDKKRIQQLRAARKFRPY